jgi:hypothetical protein
VAEALAPEPPERRRADKAHRAGLKAGRRPPADD